jgi:hypothetical protein
MSSGIAIMETINEKNKIDRVIWAELGFNVPLLLVLFSL